MALVPVVRGVVHQLDPKLPLSEVRTQMQQITETLTQERLFAWLSAFFGVLAVLLACIGLYGLMAYIVARRRGEIAIRIALGAEGRDISRMVMKEMLSLISLGVALGISAVFATTRLVATFLYGVRATDPFTILMCVLILAIAAGLATYLPVRRAAQVDPMVPLRSQ